MTDGLLHDACGVLHSFIHTHSAAWAPIISSVSIITNGHKFLNLLVKVVHHSRFMFCLRVFFCFFLFFFIFMYFLLFVVIDGLNFE